MDLRDRPHLLPDGAACTACGAPVPTGGGSFLDVAADASAATPGHGTLRPITGADVEAVRDDLAAWHGDLVGWLETREDSGRSGSVAHR